MAFSMNISEGAHGLARDAFSQLLKGDVQKQSKKVSVAFDPPASDKAETAGEK